MGQSASLILKLRDIWTVCRRCPFGVLKNRSQTRLQKEGIEEYSLSIPLEPIIRISKNWGSFTAPKREYRRVFHFDTIETFHSEFIRLVNFHCSKKRVSKNIPFRYRQNFSFKVQKISEVSLLQKEGIEEYSLSIPSKLF
jgi:hypothetical protein